jgi:toxin ParE1/3/4
VKPARYHSEALSELDSAADGYAGIDDDLAREFRGAHRDARERIKANPKMYAVDDDTLCREAPLKKFPYSLHYMEFDDCIWILAVAHQKRRKGYWIDRLKDLSPPA